MKKIILIILLFSLKVSSQVTLQTIYETPDSQINVYVVSQGFTNATMANFDSFAAGFLNVLWTTEPYQTNKPRFRVIIVKDPAAVDTHPRAFNQFNPPSLCTGASAADVAGSETPETFYARMDQLVADHIPGYDDHSYLIAIFNNKFYTGGGGRYTFATTYCASSYPYMHHVLVHEFSHSFGLLGDEYFSNAAAVDPNDFPVFHDRNVTMETTREEVPWNYLIQPSTPVPTCSSTTSCTATAVGTYLGANYVTNDWYRPVPNCKMRSVLQPLCPVCQDIVTEKIKEHFCKPNVTVTEDFVSRHQEVIHYRKSTDYLTASSQIGERIHVDFVAEAAIDLTLGFDSEAGSIFSADIHDCMDIDVRNPYRIQQNNTFFACHLRPGEGGIVEEELAISGIGVRQLKLFPNPSTGLVEIAIENGIVASITILAVDGKMVFEKQLQNSSQQIDVSDFSKGIYIINVTANDGKVFSSKLVKE